MGEFVMYQNYSRVGDVIAIATCIVLFIIFASTYTIKERNIRLFRLATVLVIIASLSSIFFHMLAEEPKKGYVWLIYILHFIKDFALIFDFVVFGSYISNIVGLKGKKKKALTISLVALYTGFIIMELILALNKVTFFVDSNLKVHQNYYLSPFWFAYVLFCMVIGILLFTERNKMVTKVFYCLVAVTFISVILVALEFYLKQRSYTCMTFTFPIMAVLFLFHHNAYDYQTGMLDIKAYEGYMRTIKNKKFSMIWLSLQNMTTDKMDGLSEEFYHFNERYFQAPYTFRISEDRFVVIYEDNKNKDAAQKYPKLLMDFNRLYQRFLMDYKIVFVHAHEELENGEDYLSLVEFIEQRISVNSSFQCESRDVQDFIKAKYILSELTDINSKSDLNDPRVKVYCQPVLDVKNKCFTSAGALWGLELPDCGFVFPDELIPVAERHDYIHTLSRIILNKTCQEVKRLLEEDYKLERISVNFAITELRDVGFSSEVLRIIRSNGIPYDKIAVELTESMNETEFENVKNVMTKLNQAGVKFYLDDFGTGYSNFDRIIDLPIDMIKFDRSLTEMSGKDSNSRFMVESFSDIFKNSNYQILFEGVEDSEDEMRCKEMNALYLQGYKYSKPIPIEELRDFLQKK